MGNSSSFSYEGECCEAKVDIVTLLSAIMAIVGVSAYLRQAVIDFMIMMARRKKRSLELTRNLILGENKALL